MRGKQAVQRELPGDPRYGNPLITKFINYLMMDGKKSTAQRVVYDAFDMIASKTKQDPLDVFDTAVKNVTPALEVRGRRVGGANYQVPFPVRGNRRYALAFRWLLTAARARKGKPMHQKLADELVMAAEKEGAAIKKKMDVHRMAEANRAFAHFARFGRRRR